MGRGTVTAEILSWLTGRPADEKFTLGDLCTALGREEAQVQPAMYRLVKAGKWPLEVISPGHVWRNLGDAGTVAEIEDDGFRAEIVEALGNHLILRGADGYLYSAKRIGIAED